jgi:hypothetical protein
MEEDSIPIGDPTNLDEVTRTEQKISFESPNRADAEVPTIPSDDSLNFRIGDFWEDDIEDPVLGEIDSVVDMSGENVTFTVFYEVDGEEFEQQLEVEVAGSTSPTTTGLSADTQQEQNASFAVDITDTNSPAEENETLEVDYTVRNTGDAAGTQDVFLMTDEGAFLEGMDLTVDTDNVTLGAGESASGTLEWDEMNKEPGEFSVTVETDDTTDTTNVEIIEEGEPEYSVEITEAPDDAEPGDNITVVAEVENVGGAGGLTDAEFAVGGENETIEGLALMIGDSETVEFEYTVVEGDAPGIDATVSAGDDSDTENITVGEPTDETEEDGTPEAPEVE